MKIKAAVIGSGIGLKHLEAINQHGQANVKILYEKNKLKNRRLKKLFPNIKIKHEVQLYVHLILYLFAHQLKF